ncbi:MAG: nucleoside triphosphate pyrophosphohydrolase [Epulopiscium sp.]|nr:nucleoside triphosphate pyrophosphohydrolase [Candidatus Epulonipiscium sp.]
MAERYTFEDLKEIVKKLRSKDGCPWDKVQTHQSLISPLIEESYEVVEAIQNHDMENLCEELGDLFLHVIFHADIASEENNFTIDDVMTTLGQKLIRRHPHIFGDIHAETPQEVKHHWESIKKQEKGYIQQSEILKNVPTSLPALLRAYKVQQKAAHVGFDFDEIQEVMGKIEEEWLELKDALKANEKDEIMEELGDYLFSIVNFSRFLNINPEITLTNTIEKFINRFVYVEQTALTLGKSLEEMTLQDMNILWEQSKKEIEP